MWNTRGRGEVKKRFCGTQQEDMELRRGYVEYRRQMWTEGEVMWSTGVD